MVGRTPKKVRTKKVLRMKPPISENDRMLRAIIFRLSRASQLPYQAKSNKSNYFILFCFAYFSYYPGVGGPVALCIPLFGVYRWGHIAC